MKQNKNLFLPYLLANYIFTHHFAVTGYYPLKSPHELLKTDGEKYISLSKPIQLWKGKQDGFYVSLSTNFEILVNRNLKRQAFESDI